MPNEPSTVSSAPRIRSWAGHDETDRLRRTCLHGPAPAPLRRRARACPGCRLPRRSGPRRRAAARPASRRRRASAPGAPEPAAPPRRSRGELLDALGETGEVLGRAPKRREGRSPRLVRQRDGDLGACRQRLEQRPLGAGQILEAVGEDRLAVPRVEVGPEPLDRMTAKQPSIPAPEAVELVPVTGVEHAELAVDRRRERAALPRARRAPARATRRSPHVPPSGE